MTNNKNHSAPGKTLPYIQIAALLLILCAIPLVYFRDSVFVRGISVHRLTGGAFDLTGPASDALRQEIATQSGGQIKLASFEKTDGQEVKIFGAKGYNLKFKGALSFAANGYWLTHNPMAGGGLTFTFSPTPVAFGGMNGQVQVAAGNSVKIAGMMTGQKSEQGWQFSVADCGIAQ